MENNQFFCYFSSILIVDREAFNIATVIHVNFTNSVFHDIKEKGITLRGWTHVFVANNTFYKLAKESINVPHDSERQDKQIEFRFANNILDVLEPRALVFNIADHTILHLDQNIFIQRCRCDFYPHLSQFVISDEYLIQSLLNDSYCTVSSAFASCFHQPEGITKISYFSRYACSTTNTIQCQKEDQTTTTNPNIFKAVDILNNRQLHQEQVVIVIVTIVAAIGTLIAASFAICLLFGRTLRFPKDCHLSSVSRVLSSMFSRFGSSGHMVPATSTGSITRVSIHDYAEVLPHKMVDIAEDDTYVCEDKATQTLPEEMTQELLQTLREKLNDPENCDEARNMIEHLYDLIKVEECCNNNVLGDQTTELDFENYGRTADNVYDNVKSAKNQPRIRRNDRTGKTTTTRGTRAPSPDKLSPLSFTTLSFSNSTRKRIRTPEPPVTEYTEPSDRRSNIYSEPLYYRNDPSTTSRYLSSTSCDTYPTRSQACVTLLADYKSPRDAKIPIYSELVSMTDRPLPSTPNGVGAVQVKKDLSGMLGTRI